MNREEAIAFLKEQEPDFLEPAKTKVKGRQTYICPVCGNGSGEKGDGIARDPKTGRYHCFSCGKVHEDVIGLWKIHTGIADDRQAFEGLYAYYEMNVEQPTAWDDFQPAYQKQPKSERYTQEQPHTNTYTQEPETDYTGFFLQANKNLGRTNYHRGLSLETLNRFKVGFVEQWKHPSVKSQKAPLTPRLIIPTSKHSYLARDTRNLLDVPENYRASYNQYSKMKVGGSCLFNLEALEQDKKPVFIVEGEIDAMSITEVGGEAVGLGSIANAEKLLKLLQNRKPKQPLILALDNDNSGQEATDRLAKDLEALGISFYRSNPYGRSKDANSALLENKDLFGGAIFTAIKEALEATGKVLEAQKEEYRKTATDNYLQGFIDGITDSVNTPYIPTGFPKLDELLDGGLYEGLYFLGAISSLGKTTLALQIADQIAEAGTDVLIFSLEMARYELMAKSISRLTILDVLQNNGEMRNAKTTRGITTGTRWANYSKTETELIQRAITAYGSYAGNIYIQEGIGNIGAEQVKEAVKKHISLTGKKPVVLIDYVQILAPADIKASDKQNTDKAVLELKRISRDFKIPVIGISSFNRDSYKNAVSMEAFKESGALEYGSDVLIGLQLKGAGAKEFKVDEAKQKNPRDIELVILKNRNGATGKKVDYNYYPMFNYFKEV